MIGIFDSGFGGLTILKEFLYEGENYNEGEVCKPRLHCNSLQQYDYLYLGDNARAPYGNKSQDVIYNYACEAVDFLFKQGCELIIIACNTVSAKALRKIQQEWLPKYEPDKRVLGVVIPVVEQAVENEGDIPECRLHFQHGCIGVIGTRATVESGVYEQELKKLKSGTEVYQQACPLLVPLIEEGWIKKQETKMILKKYLRPLKQKKIDTLILGCTHYSFLIKDIQRIMGKNCRVLDSSKIVAEKLKDYLSRHPKIENKISKNKQRLFYTTDDPTRFKRFGEKFLSGEIKKVERVEL